MVVNRFLKLTVFQIPKGIPRGPKAPKWVCKGQYGQVKEQ